MMDTLVRQYSSRYGFSVEDLLDAIYTWRFTDPRRMGIDRVQITRWFGYCMTAGESPDQIVGRSSDDFWRWHGNYDKRNALEGASMITDRIHYGPIDGPMSHAMVVVDDISAVLVSGCTVQVLFRNGETLELVMDGKDAARGVLARLTVKVESIKRRK